MEGNSYSNIKNQMSQQNFEAFTTKQLLPPIQEFYDLSMDDNDYQLEEVKQSRDERWQDKQQASKLIPNNTELNDQIKAIFNQDKNCLDSIKETDINYTTSLIAQNSNCELPVDAELEVLDSSGFDFGLRSRDSIKDGKRGGRKLSTRLSGIEGNSSSGFVFVEEDEDAIIDYHQHHTLKKEATFKQKLAQKLTNIGYKFFKSGDSKLKKTLLKDSAINNSRSTLLSMGSNTEELKQHSSQESGSSSASQVKLQTIAQETDPDSSLLQERWLTLMGKPYFDIDEFYEEFRKLIWITYRSEFRPLLIEKKQFQDKKIRNLATDCNWGCTIRAAQMLIANTLIKARVDLSVTKLLDLFDDNERGKRENAYSIQNIAVEGLQQFGKVPGEWYGVGAVSNIIETLTMKYMPVDSFRLCVFQDGNVIFNNIENKGLGQGESDYDGSRTMVERKSEVADKESFGFNEQRKRPGQRIKEETVCIMSGQENDYGSMEFHQQPQGIRAEDQQASESFSDQASEWTNQVLVIINVRLGLESVPQVYHSSILECVRLPQFTGLLGGKPKKAFYFCGAHEQLQKLIFIDPHLVHRHVPDINGANKHLYQQFPGKYHVLQQDGARMLHLSKLDPCMGFAFLLKDRTEYVDFKQKLREMSLGSNSLFSLFNTEEDFMNDLDSQAIQSYHSSVRSSLLPPTSPQQLRNNSTLYD